MTNPIDYQIRTEGEGDTAIYTDEYEGGLWLNVMLPGASARAILTRAQALALIESIQFALSANEVTA
jgi:hypothetical protein